MRRAVFLDRDGVLNHPVERNGLSGPPRSVDELKMLPGVAEACAELREEGFLLVVVTNQPDVRRGTVDRSQVEAVNQAVRKAVAVDDLRTCFHDDDDACSCRKPLPGLLQEAAEDWGIDLAASYMVGDRWKDMDAGRAAGCATILVEHPLAEPGASEPWARAASLTEAAAIILRRKRGRRGTRR